MNLLIIRFETQLSKQDGRNRPIEADHAIYFTGGLALALYVYYILYYIWRISSCTVDVVPVNVLLFRALAETCRHTEARARDAISQCAHYNFNRSMARYWKFKKNVQNQLRTRTPLIRPLFRQKILRISIANSFAFVGNRMEKCWFVLHLIESSFSPAI